jgi:hypothetical protein
MDLQLDIVVEIGVDCNMHGETRVNTVWDGTAQFMT